MELIDALKTDLGRELAVIDVYQKYVGQVKDPGARRVLLQLISESMDHADAFRALLYKKTMGIELSRSGLSEVALSNLLVFGMKEEREVRLLYESELPFLKDEEYAAVIRRIIEDEKRHEAMLKQVFNTLAQKQ